MKKQIIPTLRRVPRREGTYVQYQRISKVLHAIVDTYICTYILHVEYLEQMYVL